MERKKIDYILSNNEFNLNFKLIINDEIIKETKLWDVGGIININNFNGLIHMGAYGHANMFIGIKNGWGFMRINGSDNINNLGLKIGDIITIQNKTGKDLFVSMTQGEKVSWLFGDRNTELRKCIRLESNKKIMWIQDEKKYPPNSVNYPSFQIDEI
jgi:hypothetical protein